MIWCVEDDPSIREIEVYALNSTGLEACGFEDGSAFWEALQQKQPDLVLLDVMLPGMDGLELLTRLKASERFRDLPVIMATAKGSEFDKVRSLDMGADDYITKSCKAPPGREQPLPSHSEKSSPYRLFPYAAAFLYIDFT